MGRRTLTATDWDAYYESVPATAKLTRRYTTAVLLNALRMADPAAQHKLNVVEIGGANSCFLDAIVRELRPAVYSVVDTNRKGLSLLEKRAAGLECVQLRQESVLAMSLGPTADVAFSVGLVEHFDERQPRAAVLAHFDVVRTGGLVVISFPTPTPLYRATRKLIEAVGMWKFHDERPLSRGEVLPVIAERGEILREKVLWPLMLTQSMVVAKKIR
jgi:SAM-dependent methyltransferase